MKTSQLKKISYDSKEMLCEVLSEIIEKATGASEIPRLEKAHIRTLVKVWNETATPANKAALNTFPKNETPFKKADANKVLKSLDSSFNGIENKTKKVVLAYTEKVYKAEKKYFATKNKLKPKEERDKCVLLKQEVPEIGTTFDLTDEALVAEIARIESISIGNHFPANKRPFIAKSIERGIEQGLNKKQMGAFLQKELTEKLGGKAFAVPPSVAAKGQNSVNAYFEGLASTNSTLGRNASHINAMNQAGVVRLVFDAIIDNRTSQICSQMNGRVFTIEQANNHLNTILESEDVDDLKNRSGWVKSMDEIPGNSSGTKISSDALAEAGVLVPPLHFRCRSELNPA